MATKKDSSAARINWLDEQTGAPVIDRYARQLDSFIQTMADGRVDAHEISAQEARVVKLMKEIEPQLDDKLHAMVTELLCEMTAYDIMQMLHTMQEARPRTTFRG